MPGYILAVVCVMFPLGGVHAEVLGQGTGTLSFRDFGALPYIGPAAAVNLDSELDAIGRARGLDSKTAQTLRTVAGKHALWQAIANYILDQRDVILQRALARQSPEGMEVAVTGEPGTARLAAVYYPLIRYAGELAADVDSLEKTLRRIARKLEQDSATAKRLNQVLQQPGAAQAVYLSFLYPAYLADGGLPGVEDKLLRGKGDVAADPWIRSTIDKLRPLLGPMKRLAEETVRDAAMISDRDELHRAYRKALIDPMTTAVTASIQMRRNPEISPEQLQAAVSRGLNQSFTRSGKSRVLLENVDRNVAGKSLRLLGRLRALAAGNAGGMRSLLAAMDTATPPKRDSTKLLSSDFMAASLISAGAFEPSLDEFFSRSTIFGSSLFEEKNGSWSINPHRKREAAIAVAYLEQRLRDYQTHKDLLAKKARALGSSEVEREFIAYIMLQIAELETLRDIDGLARQWINTYFETSGGEYRLRESMSGQLERIAKSVVVNETPLTIETRGGAYSREHIDLFRSSTYLYMHSKFSREVYFDEFDDHYAARLWGIFDWNAQDAENPQAFRSALEKQGPFLRKIAATHEKVIIYVFHTPRWLSNSNDRQQVDGRPAYLLHSPKDYQAWQNHVHETVQFLRRQLQGVDVYYEVWNEPDIYWLENNKDYLRLYAETVTAIKQAHPEAKVGGAAMNIWDGKAKGERGGSALNLELIRYVAKHKIPLDFISWHYFERPLTDPEVARQAYLAELEKAGAKSVPEFVISEWSSPGRGTGKEALGFAEYMLSLYRSGVAIQTVAVWEEFSVLPRPKYFTPWGMLTVQGLKKPMFHVHTYFDRLSRNSDGIAVFESKDQRTKVVASRKRDGSYELVTWESGYSLPMESALKVLEAEGLTNADLRPYGSIDRLENSIRTGKAIDKKHSAAFRKASEAYRDTRQNGGGLELRFEGAKHLRVTASEAVGIRSAGRQVFTSGNDLLTNLPRGEVMWLRVEVDR